MPQARPGIYSGHTKVPRALAALSHLSVQTRHGTTRRGPSRHSLWPREADSPATQGGRGLVGRRKSTSNQGIFFTCRTRRQGSRSNTAVVRHLNPYFSFLTSKSVSESAGSGLTSL